MGIIQRGWEGMGTKYFTVSSYSYNPRVAHSTSYRVANYWMHFASFRFESMLTIVCDHIHTPKKNYAYRLWWQSLWHRRIATLKQSAAGPQTAWPVLYRQSLKTHFIWQRHHSAPAYSYCLVSLSTVVRHARYRPAHWIFLGLWAYCSVL